MRPACRRQRSHLWETRRRQPSVAQCLSHPRVSLRAPSVTLPFVERFQFKAPSGVHTHSREGEFVLSRYTSEVIRDYGLRG